VRIEDEPPQPSHTRGKKAPPTPPAARIDLKVVPGSRTDEVVGPHGDRLKVRVAAPPEDGKANAAVCELLARTLGIHPRQVSIIRGTTSAEKTARVEGLDASQLRARLTPEE
jgi:uncharacterized protein (TIGR00251 family)